MLNYPKKAANIGVRNVRELNLVRLPARMQHNQVSFKTKSLQERHNEVPKRIT
jgi:hypothetical protein